MRTNLVIFATLIISTFFALPASAAPSPIGPTEYQKICNSGASYRGSVVEYNSGYQLSPGECKTLPKGSTLRLDVRSFRVAYDYGDYRGCQNTFSNGSYIKVFKPATGPDVIYFKLYEKTDCRN